MVSGLGRYIANASNVSMKKLKYYLKTTSVFQSVLKETGDGEPKTVFLPLQRESLHQISNKVTVVGAGQVGMAVVFALLTQGVTNNVVIVDTMVDRLRAETMDLQQGSVFLNNASILASTDFQVSKNSRICVLTKDENQEDYTSRLDLAQKSTNELKHVIPQLVKYSPGTILLIANNPVDIMTYVTWKISGLPKNRVIGSGTNLDSARFRYLLSEKLGVAPTSCHGYIIGEQGDSSVPVWSGVNVAGVRLADFNRRIGLQAHPGNWQDLHQELLRNTYEVMRLKGSSSWSIGLSLSQLVNAILNNSKSVHAVSTYLRGEQGIKDEVFLSLPCVLGGNGICDIIRQPLNEDERTQLHISAQNMGLAQKNIKF